MFLLAVALRPIGSLIACVTDKSNVPIELNAYILCSVPLSVLLTEMSIEPKQSYPKINPPRNPK